MHPHYPEDRLYHRDALWLRALDGGEALVGVNHHAQHSLGAVMYVDLPRLGGVLRQGAPFGTIESGKAVSDLIAPASGTVLEINAALRGTPALVNREPYGGGWLLRIQLDTPAAEAGLFDAAGYLAFLGAGT